jgi:hypothetical protein
MSSAEGGLSDANSEGAPAGAAGGTATEVAVGKRVRQQTAKVKAALTGAERSKKARQKKTGASGGHATPTERGTAGVGAALPQAPGAGGATPVAGNSGPVVTPVDAPVTKSVSVDTAQLPYTPASPPVVSSVSRQSRDDSANEDTVADGMAAADAYVSPSKKFWSGGQGIRLVLCALADRMAGPMERLGTQSDRLETQVSSQVARGREAGGPPDLLHAALLPATGLSEVARHQVLMLAIAIPPFTPKLGVPTPPCDDSALLLNPR